MRNIVLVAAFGLLALGVASAAKADQLQKPWSIQVGATWPWQSQAQNDEGKTTLNAGVDYAFNKSGRRTPTVSGAYFDYSGGSNNSNYLYTYGVGVDLRTYAGRPAGDNASGATPYYGAGIGVYSINDKDSGTSDNSVSVGGKIFAGLEFTGSYYAEVGVQFLPSSNGADPSNLGVDVGLRF